MYIFNLFVDFVFIIVKWIFVNWGKMFIGGIKIFGYFWFIVIIGLVLFVNLKVKIIR